MIHHIRSHARVGLLAGAALFALFASADVALAFPSGQITMHSEEGEYVGQGKQWHVTGGTWMAFTEDRTGDGVVDTVRVDVGDLPSEQGLFWWTTFSTGKMGINLRPGNFSNAMRWPFEDAGRPGFDISGDGRGHNTECGYYTVHALEIDYSGEKPRVVSFGASFVQYGGDTQTGPALRGTVFYRDGSGPSTSIPYINSAKYIKKNQTVRVRGGNFMSGATMFVDEQEVDVASAKPTVVRGKGMRLAPGIHKVVVRNPDGGETFPYEIAVYSFVQLEVADEAEDGESAEPEAAP